MSSEMKIYEATALYDVSGTTALTVEAESLDDALQALEEQAGEHSVNLCYHCSRELNLGDMIGMLVFCDDQQVADTTYSGEHIAQLEAKVQALRDQIAIMAKDYDALAAALAMAEDAAAKGDAARHDAGGMEMEVEELRAELAELRAMVVAVWRGRTRRAEDELDKFKAEKEALRLAYHKANEALAEIGDFAHGKSTGPVVPDSLWEIRNMAYDAVIIDLD